MTPTALVQSGLADLRRIPLQEMPDLPPAALAALVERVLPGRPVKTVAMAGFSSAL